MYCCEGLQHLFVCPLSFVFPWCPFTVDCSDIFHKMDCFLHPLILSVIEFFTFLSVWTHFWVLSWPLLLWCIFLLFPFWSCQFFRKTHYFLDVQFLRCTCFSAITATGIRTLQCEAEWQHFWKLPSVSFGLNSKYLSEIGWHYGNGSFLFHHL